MKRNGVYEWVFQRFSNLLIIAFAAVYIGAILFMGEVDYETWTELHRALWFKVYATFTLVIVMINALLAGWQIGTDYTQKVPMKGFGAFFHSFYSLVSILFLGFGLYILWLG